MSQSLKDQASTWHFPGHVGGLSGGLEGEASACNMGDLGSIPELGRSPGEGNGTHSSTLAWKIPWTEEWGRLQSMGSQRVGHNWVTSVSTFHSWENVGNSLSSASLPYFFFLINYFFNGCTGVFIAACGLSLVAASRGFSSFQCTGFSLRWLPWCGADPRHTGSSSCSQVGHNWATNTFKAKLIFFQKAILKNRK